MTDKEKRRIMLEERKRIEALLHPYPEVDGVTILHEHRGQFIVFTPWIGKRRAACVLVQRTRSFFLATGQGLPKRDVDWLVQEAKKAEKAASV